jgi:site-specific DNA recombinase
MMRELRKEETVRLEAMVANNQGEPITATIYARKSREDKENASLDQQIAACQAFASKHSQLMRVETTLIFSEDNVSGFSTEKRKQFQRMLASVKEKKASVILVTKTDRLSRSSSDTLSLVQLFDNLGIMLISGDDQGDFSASGVFAKQVIAASNEFTVRRAIEDTMAAKKRKAEKGFSCGGPGSYGYRIEGKRYVIDPMESLVVERIYSRYIGGNSLAEITESLNAEGYKTRMGKRFNKSTVLTILKNERNCGINIWNATRKRKNRKRISYVNFPEVVCEDAVERPIISRDTFEKAQLALKNRTQGLRRTPNATYILTGIIKCHCGASMVGNTTRGGRNKTVRRTYVCSARKEHGTCSNKDVNADYLEGLIKSQLNLRLNERIQKNGVPKDFIDKQSAHYTSRIEELDNGIVNARRLMEKLVVQLATSSQLNVIQAVEAKVAECDREIDYLTAAKDEAADSFSKLLAESSSLTARDWFSNPSLGRELMTSQIGMIVVEESDVVIEIK